MDVGRKAILSILLLNTQRSIKNNMDYFNYHHHILHAESVNLIDLANKYGTPCYVYSYATLERHWYAFENALANKPHQICYAVKANSNLSLLQVLAQLGSGFDIVSGGELERVLQAGGDASKVVFSGVGKTANEMRRALQVGIACFNVESQPELLLLNQVAAELNTQAPIALRINPDIDAQTHPYISTGLKENKFGIEVDEALAIYAQAAALPHIKIEGIGCHIGSQLTQVTPFVDALQRIVNLIELLEKQDITLKHIDIGGGLGVRYRQENPPEPKTYVAALLKVLGDKPHKIFLEPGRALIANAGILLTRIQYLKHTTYKNFAIVDAAMNDLIRPALYSAWHDIIPVNPRELGNTQEYDIVGPICETGDFLGKERALNVIAGDLLAVRSCGAYAFTMSSHYNSRPRAAEILVKGTQATVIRRRETIDDLLALEQPFLNDNE